VQILTVGFNQSNLPIPWWNNVERLLQGTWVWQTGRQLFWTLIYRTILVEVPEHFTSVSVWL